MSRADVVVSTVGNSDGVRERHDRSRPANVLGRVRGPGHGAAGGGGGRSAEQGVARPRAPLVETHQGELAPHRRRDEGRQDRKDEDPALPWPSGIEHDHPLAVGHAGARSPPEATSRPKGARSRAGPAASRRGSPSPSGTVTRQCRKTSKRPRPATAPAPTIVDRRGAEREQGDHSRPWLIGGPIDRGLPLTREDASEVGRPQTVRRGSPVE